MIEIKCSGSDLLPLDAIEDFQGSLKKRTKKDIEKIITSIKKFGFSFPFFIWKGEGRNYCLDGHGRIEALDLMRQRGTDLPLFPVVYIEAENEEEAKQKLLRLNSQYGTMSLDSVLEFADGMELNMDELSLPAGSLIELAEDDEETEGDDEIPDKDETKAQSRFGEVYELGEHLLLCGDSTDPEQIADFMGGGGEG